jgi:hypothetical protein
MVRATATVAFNAIEVKGSLLPGSLLDQVAHFKAKQQGPKDYGLEKNAKLRDRIDAAWVLAKDLWADYVGLKQRAGQGLAGLHFSLLLLREVFEWDDVQPVAGWQRGEALYPITHRAFGGAVPLILKGVATGDLDQGLEQFGPEKNRKRSPHSCLQECLNADDDANWGLLCSGDRLRLLHDNASLVKPAYLGADLEWMIEGDLFDEFAVLWLTLHASRFRLPVEQGATQSGCVLDGWKREAEDTGERILNQLRGGVESALEHLGNGVLAHQANQALRLALESGALSRQAFHEELLRLVYRFLFLFTAEDRELLFAQEVGKEDPRRQIYREGYSLGRLRELALKRSAYEGNYGDLWQLQRLVFQQLSISHSPLGLPGLGGLFDTKQCPNLQTCELDNRYLLRAIKAIGWFEAGGTLTRVNYRDLNTEELGSVYEGLLELHPQVEQVGGRMQLSYGAAAGSDRKTTGSYYTPDALVKLLIESALLPVIQQRLSKAPTTEAKIQALLAIRVLDPASGSGHFLLAAGRRLALELARLRAGDDEPSEALRQQCLREVVAQCLYGVDKNPMAVELCKVALWIEAIDPGKPLSFLDAHIQCGDSLVGVFDPKVLEQGIPDGAYKALTGDNPTVCTSLKRDNASYRKTSRTGGGLQGSFNLAATPTRSPCQSRLQAIEAMPETTLAETAAKQAAYADWLQETGSDPETLAANLYTAAFFLPKTAESRAQVPTTEHLLKLLSGQPISEAMEQAVQQAAGNFRFLHWHLRFGEVMSKGGFDCVLGNPPWERIKLQEKEFFAARSEAIARAPNKAARERLIKALNEVDASEADRELVRDFELAKREAEGSGEFIRGSGRFALTAVGDLNTYALFAEHFLNLIGPKGRSGVIVPTGIATDNSTKAYFDAISSGGRLVSLYDFENRGGLFPAVDSRMKFALLTLGDDVEATDFVFFATAVNQLADQRRHFTLSADDIALINPNTRTCPVFRSQMDAELTKKIYGRVPVLVDDAMGDEGNPWGINFLRMFDMTNDSHLFQQDPGPDRLPLYEGKMVQLLNHRAANVIVNRNNQMRAAQPEPIEDIFLEDIEFEPKPQYYVRERDIEERLGSRTRPVLAFKSVTSPTNSRTFIPCLLPKCGAGNSLAIIQTDGIPVADEALLLANLSSITLDFAARQKVGGVNLNFFIVNQFPVIAPSSYTAMDKEYILERLVSIVYTSNSLREWAEQLSLPIKDPVPFSQARRAIALSELDAYYAHLYGLSRDELRYVLDPAEVMGPDYPSETFRVLKTNEIREFGEYRTQRLVLEAWDRLFGGD